MNHPHFAADYLRELKGQLRGLTATAERAMAQVDEQGFLAAPDEETNSIALTVKHLAGNMRSRWLDFLTTDGEKPDRHRDLEFVLEQDDTRDALLARWEAGWRILFEAVEALGPEDLDRTVTIRAEPHTVFQALQRQLSHYAYHVGQIVLMARHCCPGAWRTLSIARGDSEPLAQRVRRQWLERD